jgi:hypothetical protein
LKEVVNVLESDPAFKKMIENASVDDIKVSFESILVFVLDYKSFIFQVW